MISEDFISDDKDRFAKVSLCEYSTNAPLILKPLLSILGLYGMKLQLVVLLITILGAGYDAKAQKQNPSFLYKNRIISYSITRYTPSWEVQQRTEQNSSLTAESKLFRDLKSTQTSTIRSLMYLKGFEPKAVKSLTNTELIDHWKRNQVRMYFRIKYQGRHVFLAKLNDNTSRSILPFKDHSGTWELDLDFIDDPLFECLQDVNFDPFTGKFLGNCSANISFDGIENGNFIDYSWSDCEVPIRGIDLLKGRIGKCAKIDSKSTLTVPFTYRSANRKFFLDCHLNMENALVNEEELLVFESVLNGKGVGLSAVSAGESVKFKLGFHFVNGRQKNVEFTNKSGAWFHLNITLRDSFVFISIDGLEVSSFKLSHSDKIALGDFMFGGEGSAKFKLDELKIGQ